MSVLDEFDKKLVLLIVY